MRRKLNVKNEHRSSFCVRSDFYIGRKTCTITYPSPVEPDIENAYQHYGLLILSTSEVNLETLFRSVISIKVISTFYFAHLFLSISTEVISTEVISTEVISTNVISTQVISTKVMSTKDIDQSYVDQSYIDRSYISHLEYLY